MSDAHLIAAAPDLYEALERYVAASDHLPVFGTASIPDMRKANEVMAAREAAEAALARARGEA